ncbi:MAG: class I SAM-dependent methyltransferase [Thermomicrobiales bacterium]
MQSNTTPVDNGHALVLPTTQSLDSLTAGLSERAPWFYSLRFTNGATTEGITEDIAAIHRTRTDAIFSHLDRLFGERWDAVRCLDIACHEGWFSLQTAVRGASSVLSYDIRPEHIAKAQWLRDVTGLTQTHFEVRDLFALDPATLGTFDLVFFVGIFYHLENPMAALRIARNLTRGVCVLEGQVARQQEIAIGWGPVGMERRGPGLVALPGEPVHAHQPAGIVLVPTLEALRLMLLHAGFREVHLVLPAQSAYEAFQTYDRVMLFAYV